jgi:hypothetical protein
MSYLRYLCLFAHSGVQHILCFCFVSLRLVSLDCPFLIAPSVFTYAYSSIRMCELNYFRSFITLLFT